MGALRIAFERRETSNSRMEHVEVLKSRQIMHFVENLDAFNFNLAETLIHRVHARGAGGCVTAGGSNGRRGQTVAKRSSVNALCLLDWGGAAAFGAVALVCCDLRHAT
jgi:hypothetical protein